MHLFALAQLAVASAAHASPQAGAAPSSISPWSDGELRSPELGWRVFGSLGAGVATVRGHEFGDSPSGPQLELGAALSFQDYAWVLDLGAGWFRNTLSGSLADGRSIAIRTQGAALVLSPRFRVGPRWQLGPTAEIHFGIDTEYGPSVAPPVTSYLVGARGVYELANPAHPLRFWAQLATDVTVERRQAYVATAGVQLGIPLGHPAPASEPGVPPTRLSGVQKSAHTLRIALDPQKVFFATNSARLRPNVRRTLREVGDYLASHPAGWERLAIDGHADR
ncbi:MAG: hypothetical protein HY075_05600, partial [Deltaproteobacteria bacterium]|nr:hypothetical protein [Deltaproteobacteria bacterium]